MQAIIYCKSAKDQGRSIAAQEVECRSACEANGWEVGEVLTDHDIGVNGRPAFERLKDVLRKGDVLVVVDESRISRNTSELAEFRDLCAERGVMWSVGGRTFQPSRLRDNLLDTVREHISQGGDLPPLEGSAGRFRDELIHRVREMDAEDGRRE